MVYLRVMGVLSRGLWHAHWLKFYYSSVSFHADELTMFPSSRTAATLSLARELKVRFIRCFPSVFTWEALKLQVFDPASFFWHLQLRRLVKFTRDISVAHDCTQARNWLSDLCSPATVPCKGRQCTSLFGKFSCSGSFLEDIQDTFCFPTFLDFSFLLAESEGFAARPQRGIIGTGGTSADFDFIFVLFCCLVSVQCSLKLVNFGTMRGLVTVDEDKLKSLASDATIFVVVELAEQLSEDVL